MTLTLYVGGTLTWRDYECCGFENGKSASDDDEIAIFTVRGGLRNTIHQNGQSLDLDAMIKPTWEEYSTGNRCVTVRLGEGILNNGFAGGYILNDTFLPGLQVEEDGHTVGFRWREALGELMREEMFMKGVTQGLVSHSHPVHSFIQRLLLACAVSKDFP